MTIITRWFLCDCGRNFIEHHPAAEPQRPAGTCPDCATVAQEIFVSETVTALAAVTAAPRRMARQAKA